MPFSNTEHYHNKLALSMKRKFITFACFLAVNVGCANFSNLTQQDKAVLLEASYQTVLVALDYAQTHGAIKPDDAAKILPYLNAAKQAFDAYHAARAAGTADITSYVNALEAAIVALNNQPLAIQAKSARITATTQGVR